MTRSKMLSRLTSIVVIFFIMMMAAATCLTAAEGLEVLGVADKKHPHKILVNPSGTEHLSQIMGYSQAVRVGNIVWVSGKTGHNHGSIPQGIEAQARLAFQAIERILTEAGSSLADVVELVTYHKSMDDLGKFIEVKSEFFPENYPAWTAIGVTELVLPGLLVEVKATAVIGSGSQVELFASIGGNLHGITFDGLGNMFVAKDGREIFKITSAGEVSPFAIIEEAKGYYVDGYGDTYVYDMEFGKDGNLYVAAEDRVLKITREGRVLTLSEGGFSGTWGACGIAVDKENHLFVSHSNEILKIGSDGKRSLFLDGKKKDYGITAAVGVEFDATFENLYVCDGGTGAHKLIKIPVTANGLPGKARQIFENPDHNIEYIAIDDQNNIILKGPWSESFVMIKNDSTHSVKKYRNISLKGIETIAFGKKGFEEEAIYATHWGDGNVYKIRFTGK